MMIQSALRIPLIKGKKTYQSITTDILDPMRNKPGNLWYIGIFISASALSG